MSVYVDNAGIMFKGKPRHHLMADTVSELHTFCAAIGIARCWYHPTKRHPHYDVTDEQRVAALLAGAIAVTSRELVATRIWAE